ncbi:arginyltransferase [Photobacterium jeanii]|uniref:Aspartate/glutamate leucyltransferase n=1 Tax=Photobacterium jeanii TaxID=858640 RepID=A0A178KMN3_9GAMM|nr:arginyltransferase [Photobacterium jeanii]OAN18386.1 arginyltransferase [Photobacterium jeanii]PST91933.1 arginyltransferase [Photobacterium jeanii]
MNDLSFRIGLTPSSQCNYLPEQREQLGVVIDQEWLSPQGYQMLIASGYRRSGKAIYKPMCQQCQACIPLRIDCYLFQPSKSQKRQLKQMKKLRWEFKTELDVNWFTLYEKYITARHADGSMYPPNKDHFFEFSTADWMDSLFLHVYEGDQLIAIAVTDVFESALSAVYSFFDPDCTLSLGTLCVLFQIQYCRHTGRRWLYPGYQINECKAMNYKVRFQPHQKLINGRWHAEEE